jgi:hypothetical protein
LAAVIAGGVIGVILSIQDGRNNPVGAFIYAGCLGAIDAWRVSLLLGLVVAILTKAAALKPRIRLFAQLIATLLIGTAAIVLRI